MEIQLVEQILAMTWQDWVIGGGQIFFFLALVPSIRSADKPALATSLMTASILSAFVITFSTLSLWFSAATAGLVALGWYILFFQKLAQRHELTK